MLVTAVITGEYIEEAQPKYAGYRCGHWGVYRRGCQNMLVTTVITGEYIEEAQPKYAGYRCGHW